MPFFLAIAIAGFALGYWLVVGPRRRRARRQTHAEIETTRQTGMPTVETALGRIAREVATAQDEKLRTPPPIHGTARWATEQDALALIEVTI